MYWVFRAQADWAFILPPELPMKELRHLAKKNAAAALSDFSVRGATRQHFSWQVAQQHFRRKFQW
jgi:hypothetical protein